MLAEIKSDDLLLDIPVVVLSCSANPDDINYAYRHHAACYIRKSMKLAPHMDAIRTLKELWFHTASFPTKATAANVAI